MLELQRAAMDDSVSISSLLRKALAVAAKLQIGDADEWIRRELNGYPKGVEVPPYRVVTGQLMADNPQRGLIPVLDTETGRVHQHQLPVREPAAALELMVSGEGEARVPVQSIESEGIRFECCVPLSKPALHAALDGIRNAVHEWALALEARGILGAGLSFSEAEKSKALGAQSVIFNAPVTGAIVQRSDSGSLTATTNVRTQFSVEDLLKFVASAREVAAKLDPDANTELVDALARIETTAKDAKPNKSKLVAGLTVAADVLKTAKYGHDLWPVAVDLIQRLLHHF